MITESETESDISVPSSGRGDRKLGLSYGMEIIDYYCKPVGTMIFCALEDNPVDITKVGKSILTLNK